MKEIFRKAIEEENFKIIKILFDNDAIEDQNIFNNLFYKNIFDLPLIHWLIENKCPWGNAINISCQKGNFEVIQLLCENKCPYNDYTIKEAVFWTSKTNNYDILNFLLKDYYWSGITNAYEPAIDNNNIKLVKYLYGKGCPLNHQVTYYSSCKNNFEMLRLFSSYGCSLHRCYEGGIINENTLILRYVKNRGYSLTSNLYEFAVKNRKIKSLQWLKDNGCPYDRETWENTQKFAVPQEIKNWANKNIKKFYWSDCL